MNPAHKYYAIRMKLIKSSYWNKCMPKVFSLLAIKYLKNCSLVVSEDNFPYKQKCLNLYTLQNK